MITINGCKILKKGVKSPTGIYTPAWFNFGPLNSTGQQACTIYSKCILKDLPKELGNIENNTDIQTDYFEKDRVRFHEGSKEYELLRKEFTP